jgi:ABC-type dipeptide/oligopeptide/nickel transport system permease subunit
VTSINNNFPNAAGGAGPPEEVVEDAPQSVSREAWKRLRRSRLSMACLIIVGLYLLTGLASFLPVFDRKIDEPFSDDKTYAPPAFRHVDLDGVSRISPAVWFGLDFGGRSVFWRVLYGTRVALIITICASVLSIGIGMVLGVMAGYFGGWIDDAITWLFSTVSSIPWLLLVIAVTYVLKEGPATSSSPLKDLAIIILALGLTDWVSLCRLIRGEVIMRSWRSSATSGGSWRRRRGPSSSCRWR